MEHFGKVSLYNGQYFFQKEKKKEIDELTIVATAMLMLIAGKTLLMSYSYSDIIFTKFENTILWN